GLAGGIDSVPGTGSQDNFPAVLAPGERVVPRETNQDLTAFLEARQGPQTIINVNIGGNVLDTRESGLRIVEIINEAISANGVRLLTT
ncbi:MAG: hypothetical protein ABIP54_04740, partial [Candidatus Andersenbacteria bacterium]